MHPDPVSPRTPSPSLSDHNSPDDDEHGPALTQEHPRDAQSDHSDHSVHSDPAAATASKDKGKDRARRPLRLLDLPVDILKEIIQQVSEPPEPPACAAHPLTACIATTHQRPHLAVALPLGPPPPHRPMHLLSLRHRLAR